MRPFARLLFALAAVVAAGILAGCSDSLISSRDDQHVPSVPPAAWEGNPLGVPGPSQSGH
jgi:hypothetical protein